MRLSGSLFGPTINLAKMPSRLLLRGILISVHLMTSLCQDGNKTGPVPLGAIKTIAQRREWHVRWSLSRCLRSATCENLRQPHYRPSSRHPWLLISQRFALAAVCGRSLQRPLMKSSGVRVLSGSAFCASDRFTAAVSIRQKQVSIVLEKGVSFVRVFP